MVNIAREIKARGLHSRMITQVHDELVFDVVPAELDELRALVIDKMQGAYTAKVPLTVSAGVGKNWLEAH
jgi:DNA polymerase-1